MLFEEKIRSFSDNDLIGTRFSFCERLHLHNTQITHFAKYKAEVNHIENYIIYTIIG